jgi:hypothetical protein
MLGMAQMGLGNGAWWRRVYYGGLGMCVYVVVCPRPRRRRRVVLMR